MVKLEVELLKYDTVKDSGRIYTKEIALNIIEQFKKTPEPFFGELDEDQTTEIVNLHNVSHRITEMKLNEDTKTIIGTIEILDTPKGRDLEKLIDNGVHSYDMQPRGCGFVDDKTNEVYNYDFITFDIVPRK